MSRVLGPTLGRYPILTQMIIFDLCFFEPCLHEIAMLQGRGPAEQEMAAAMLRHHALRRLKGVYRGWSAMAKHDPDNSHELLRRVLSPELIALADRTLGSVGDDE